MSLVALLRTPAVLIAAAQFALTLGCARLAYGLLIPAMAPSLQTTTAVLGALSAVNFVGYLLGMLLIPWAQRHLTGRQLVVSSGLVLACSLVLTAVVTDLVTLSALRLVGGVVSAPLMILTQTFALEAAAGPVRGQVMGIVWGGGAAGILLSGLVAPLALSTDGWRVVWAASGILVLVITLGWRHTVRGDMPRQSVSPSSRAAAPAWSSTLLWVALAYSCFGAGYISYFTYAVATFVAQGLPTRAIGYVWATLGAVALVSGPFWGWVIDRKPSVPVLAGVLALGALGATTLLTTQLWVLVVGAALVGWCAFIAPPLIVATLVRRQVDAARYPAVFGACTVGFGVGQVLAPLLSGALSVAFGLGAAAAVSVVALALGALAALRAGTDAQAAPVVRSS